MHPTMRLSPLLVVRHLLLCGDRGMLEEFGGCLGHLIICLGHVVQQIAKLPLLFERPLLSLAAVQVDKFLAPPVLLGDRSHGLLIGIAFCFSAPCPYIPSWFFHDLLFLFWGHVYIGAHVWF